MRFIYPYASVSLTDSSVSQVTPKDKGKLDYYLTQQSSNWVHTFWDIQYKKGHALKKILLALKYWYLRQIL